ncbi:hypothetical protein [Peribacillus simplex]|uniref:hypothetical protein n=1 Tax=Peribacillus TaxID=2675229 RepID=UPI0025599642|nr:hypothetical protein [Peribacillus simplex]
MQSVYLLGHSMGSAISLDSTSRIPKVVKALILSDATRGAAVVSMEESKRKLLYRLQSIET